MLEHEYLVPILVGNGDKTRRIAKRIKKLTGIRPHIFSNRFSIVLRLRCFCHLVSPIHEDFLREYLISFAGTLDSFQFPVIIVTDTEVRSLIDKYRDNLESSFLIVEPTDILI